MIFKNLRSLLSKIPILYHFILILKWMYRTLRKQYIPYYLIISKEEKFRFVFGFCAYMVGWIIFLLSLQTNRIFYTIAYFYFAFVTFFVITQVSESMVGKTIGSWKFLYFILRYLLTLILYIINFATIFLFIVAYNDGGFVLEDGFYAHLNTIDYLYVSAFNFLTIDTNYLPIGFMKLAIFSEVFIGQIFILTFVFITFDRLLKRFMKSKGESKDDKI